jgi:Domain of unknown function (DUF4365)
MVERGGSEGSHLGLPLDQAKAVYSASYLDAVCAQAGVGMTSIGLDKDTLAVDATVNFMEMDVRVQLKCTSSPNLSGDGYRVDLKQKWIDKWRAFIPRPYVVLVVVPVKQNEWIRHPEDHTKHETVAYWQRFDPASTAMSIHMPKSSRLTADTLGSWRQQVLTEFLGLSADGVTTV